MMTDALLEYLRDLARICNSVQWMSAYGQYVATSPAQQMSLLCATRERRAL